MKTRNIQFLLLWLIGVTACQLQEGKNQKKDKTTESSDSVVLSPGASLLFKDVTSLLTARQKNEIFNQTTFLLTKQGDGFYFEGGEDFPFLAAVFPVDLNKDGVEEIFILWGNMFTSGNAGNNVSLFIQNKKGKYTDQLGVQGQMPLIVEDPSKSYPDLIIPEPGSSFPLWGWRNDEYVNVAQIAENILANYKTINSVDLSEQYVKSVKVTQK